MDIAIHMSSLSVITKLAPGKEWAYNVRHVNFVRYVFPPSELYKKLLAG